MLFLLLNYVVLRALWKKEALSLIKKVFINTMYFIPLFNNDFPI